MKKVLGLLILMGFLFSGLAEAKRRAPEVGSIETFTSKNGTYAIEIRNLGYPDGSPSECVFKDRKRIAWRKEIPTTPGKVNISDDGEYIVMANWGWYDEGGFEGLSFYRGDGALIKSIKFEGKGRNAMIWIDNTSISSSGKYFILTADGNEKAKLYLYNGQSGNLLWNSECGFERSIEVEISEENSYILFATSNYNSGNMQFILLDITGNIITQKEIEGNFSWNIDDYIRIENDELEIFNKADNKFIPFINKVIRK